VETANVHLDESYASTRLSVVPGPHVMLAVADTGIGMTAEVRARLFEPFFTTKEPGKGTGLGLASIHGIVRQSGGNIWVYSEPGHGTTFKIYLPRAEESDAIAGPADAAMATLDGAETILVVEDSSSLRILVSKILHRYGYSVLSAATAEDALHLCHEHGGSIHLLLTDVVMPGTSGPSLASQLTSQHPAMRVLYMSGYTDDAIVRHGLLQGRAAFLQKPFAPDRLARKVRQVLDAANGRTA
jgi:CheY-like chemotaxis protein